MLHHQLLPPLFGQAPQSLNGVQGTAIRWKEPLLDPFIEVVSHCLRIVNAQVVHVHISLPFDLANQL